MNCQFTIAHSPFINHLALVASAFTFLESGSPKSSLLMYTPAFAPSAAATTTKCISFEASPATYKPGILVC